MFIGNDILPSSFGNPEPFWIPAPSGSATPWVTGAGAGTLRADFSGWVGARILVGASPISVSQIGRVWVTGNSGTGDVGIFDDSGNPISIVTVNLASGVNNDFNYASATPTLSAATNYIIASLESSGGNQWRDAAAVSTTAVASIVLPMFRSGSGTTGAFSIGGAAGTMYVPVNFTY